MKISDARLVLARFAVLSAVMGVVSVPLVHAAEPASSIAIDGDFSDWRGTDSAAAGGAYVYFRVRLPEVASLTNNPRSLELHIDFDGSADTGLAETIQGATRGTGTDVCVRFSPAASYDEHGVEHAGKHRGAAVWIATPPHVIPRPGSGANPRPELKEVGHAGAGLLSAPSVASDVYELRVDRAELAKAGCSAAALGGDAAWWAQLVDRDGTVVAASGVQTLTLEPLNTQRERAGLAETIPAKPAAGDGLRVVSCNVLFASPMKNPEPFARVFKTLDPDIVLVQEWERGNFKDAPSNEPRPGAAGIAAWFNRYLPLENGEWSVIDSAGWGVAVVTRFPVTRLGPERVSRSADMPGDQRDNDSALRFAGGMIETPIGPVAAASIHLKCCGSASGQEEQTRLAEARTINALMNGLDADAADGGRARGVIKVIAGDFNLVGTRGPLETVSRGIDADGSDLLIVDTPTLGDASIITWNDAASEFPPSRLDYFLLSDAVATPSHAFVFDTAHLSASLLARLGLRPDDSTASDHRPVVVDLVKAR